MSATCHRLISVCSHSFPPHWQRIVSSPSDWSVYPLQPSDWFRLTSFSFLWLIDPTLRPFEVRDWVIWKQSWQKCKFWPIRSLGYHHLTNEKPQTRGSRNSMEDHCRNKERHLSGEIFQGLAKNISLTSWHIPRRSVRVTNSGHYTPGRQCYHCLKSNQRILLLLPILFSTVGQDIDV